MKIGELIYQPEGRRLEFKESIPVVADLARTIVAFANDAGGDLYIGIKNDPRELTGIPEDDLFKMEEQISNIIHDHCYPIIIPEISFQSIDEKHFIHIQIYRGSNLPYYIKSNVHDLKVAIVMNLSTKKQSMSIYHYKQRQPMNLYCGISIKGQLLKVYILHIIGNIPLKLFAKLYGMQ
jgi:predicted HTH transcriptional regulator